MTKAESRIRIFALRTELAAENRANADALEAVERSQDSAAPLNRMEALQQGAAAENRLARNPHVVRGLSCASVIP